MLSSFNSAQKLVLFIVLTVVGLFVVAGLVAVSIADHETSDVLLTRLATLTGIGTAAFSSIYAVVISRNNGNKVDQVQQDVAQVKTQTNGPISQLAANVEDIHNATVNSAGQSMVSNVQDLHDK